MVQLRTKRSALFAYLLLLVLPAAVLAPLLWRQLEAEHEQELAALPGRAADAAGRLGAALAAALAELLASEERRPFQHYAPVSLVEDPVASGAAALTLAPSPLALELRPAGVLGWFAFDRLPEPETSARILVGSGDAGDLGGPSGPGDGAEVLAHSVQVVMQAIERDSQIKRLARIRDVRDTYCDVLTAAVHLSGERGVEDTLAAVRALWARYGSVRLPIAYSGFHLQFFREADGTPRVYATRRVVSSAVLESIVAEAADVALFAPLLTPGFSQVQGLFLDPEWLFRELPAELARAELGPHELLLAAGPPAAREPPAGAATAAIEPLALLGIEVEDAADLHSSALTVWIDDAPLRERHATRRRRLAWLGGMLLLSLATGLWLLWTSVARELAQAERQENFAAAVTHELRTPLAAIKLHAEMLQAGWAEAPAQRAEYYGRIVRETERLSTLVENVLAKARLALPAPRTEPRDLNAAVRDAVESLRAGRADAEPPDVALELAPEQPRALLHEETVPAILVGLVENARKYAAAAPGGEPILVRTRLEHGRALLEVLDRGPGILAEDAERVFEAFVRLGNEATRSASGTGLGLHLVRLHARAAGGDASVHERPGGGACFRASFALAADDVA